MKITNEYGENKFELLNARFIINMGFSVCGRAHDLI